MLILQDCIQKLSDFKVSFAQKFGILKLGIFGSVARNENTEDSDIDIVVEVQKPTLQLMYFWQIMKKRGYNRIVLLYLPFKSLQQGVHLRDSIERTYLHMTDGSGDFWVHIVEGAKVFQ